MEIPVPEWGIFQTDIMLGEDMEELKACGQLTSSSVDDRVRAIEAQILQLLSILPPELVQNAQQNSAALAANQAPAVTAFDPAMLKRTNAPQTSFPAGRARMVRREICRRVQRERHFPADLFADPAWDILLDLYASHYERRTVSVSSLCIAAHVPATTALRWIKTMCDQGLLIRESDPNDGRRIFISLTEELRCRLDAYFEDLEG